MTAIRNTPANLKTYWRDMRESFTIELERSKLEYDELISSIKDKRDLLVPNLDKFKVKIIDYPEFQQNKYINGRLEDVAKGMYQDKTNTFELKHLCFRLVGYAVDLRKIYELEKAMSLYEKCLLLNGKEYRKIINTFYVALQKKMLFEGHGYRLEGKLGYVCITRILNTGAKIPDYMATKRRKEELEAQGIRVWNKEEAEFCKENGIEYDAVDCTIYRQDDAWYDLSLINCNVYGPLANKINFIDFRGVKTRGFTNDQLIKMCGEDKEKIFNLDLSMKNKLVLLLKVDKTMYTKFIRNESQTKCGISKSNRKS